jgi:hypothetical protein
MVGEEDPAHTIRFVSPTFSPSGPSPPRMQNRFLTVFIGAAVTLFIGVVGTLVPFAGNLLGPVAGGLVVATRSEDDHRVVDGFAAGLFGGIGPAIPLVFIVDWLGPYTLLAPGTFQASIVVFVGVCGAIGGIAAWSHSGSLATYETVRR